MKYAEKSHSAQVGLLSVYFKESLLSCDLASIPAALSTHHVQVGPQKQGCPRLAWNLSTQIHVHPLHYYALQFGGFSFCFHLFPS